MQAYPTGSTDSQWSKVEKLFDNRKRHFRGDDFCKIEQKSGMLLIFY